MRGTWSKRPYLLNVKVLSRTTRALRRLRLGHHGHVYRLGVPAKSALQLWATQNLVLIYQAVGLLALVSVTVISLYSPVHAWAQPNATNVLGQTNFITKNPDEAVVSGSGMDYPQATAYDSTSHLEFVADTQNNRVLVYDTTSGITNGMPASYVIGQSDFVSNSCGSVTASSLCSPAGLLYDSSDNELFVSDTDNSRILVFDLSGGVTNDMAASYVIGQGAFVDTGCNAGGLSGSTLCYPEELDYNASGSQLFVSDTDNSRILVYDLSGGITNGMAASYELGQPDFASNTCNNGGVSATSLCYNIGVTYASTTSQLFVSDSSNSRVLVYDLSGGITNDMAASYELGQTDFVSNTCSGGPSELCYPSGLSYDTADNVLFIAATSNGLLLAYDMSGGITNDMDATYDIANTISFGLNYDATDHYLFSAAYNSNQVDIYDLSSGLSNYISPSYVLGQTNVNNTIIDGALTTASDLNQPDGTVYDSTNHLLFVDDTQNSRILVYDTSSGVTNGMNASYVLGQPDLTSNSCNNGGISASSLCDPAGLAYDATDNELFVSDSNMSRILVYDLSGGITDGMAASYVLGQPDFISGGCYSAAANTLCAPDGMSYDPADSELFVADQSNNRVLVYDLSGGITDGMAASNVLGQPDFVSTACDNPGITASGICYPYSLSYDANDQDLFVADTSDSRVLAYQLSGGITDGMAASYVLGQSDFVSGYCNNNAGTTASSLCNPDGIYYDGANQQLLVADSSNDRILDYDLTNGITSDMSAVSVVGQPDFNSNGSSDTQNGLNYPSGIYFDDSTNTLWVSDSNNNRVLSYNLTFTVSIATTSLPDTETGANYNQTIQTIYGHDPITFAVTSGSLPAGLNLDTSTGAITGTPTATGLSSFTVTATDNLNNTSSQALTINVNQGVSITTTTLSDGEQGVDYGQLSQSIGVTGGASPYTFAIGSGSLPNGLSLDPNTGDLTGTPTALGTFDFTVQVTDDYGSTASQALSINIIQQIAITTLSLPNGSTTASYDQIVATQYGEGSDNFSVSAGSLPNGLGIDSSTGEITGTPTNLGTFNFTIQVTDGLDGTASQALSIDITFPPVTITTTSLPNSAIDAHYDQTIATSGGTSPFTFIIENGSLPTGLSMNSSSGEITGTTTTIGTYNFNVQVTDSNSTTDTASLSIIVEFSYAASAVLGQSNFTTSGANNGGLPGFSDPQATVIDSS
jgi:DNA-binding beta-propeller fold protein YncE